MTEIAVREPAAALAVPQDIDSWTQVAAKVIKLAEEIYDTPFVPDGLRGSVPATAAAILAGRELGLGPMTSLANIHVIKGKPALSAALMRALILAQGHQIETVGQITDTRVVVRGRRRGESTWEEASFTADQARQAKIDISGYPQDKLYARATSRLARRKFADVIAGMPYSAEDLEDGPDGVMLAGDPGYKADRQAAREAAAPPRTAQRRGRAPQNVPPAEAPSPPAHAASASPAPAATAGGTPLPPLPGEEDPGPAAQDRSEAAAGPARASTGQVGIIASHFKRLGFGDDEREQRLAATAIIAGIQPVASTKDLDEVQARAVMDTLSRCKDRDALIVLLAAGDKPGGSE
jgi:hypothetical protein